MKTRFYTLAFAVLVSIIGSSAFAGLTVNAVEFGIAKFHRIDNQVHPYSATNVWKVAILPSGATLDQTPIVIENKKSNYSLFFSSTEELVQALVGLAETTHEKIEVLNIHAHGTPGALFVPPSRRIRDGLLCHGWKKQATGDDQANYRQYYSKLSEVELALIRASSVIRDSFLTRVLAPTFRSPCLSNLHTWSAKIKKFPEFKSYFADDLKIHFLSCSVGLGKGGDQFTKGIAGLFLNSPKGQVNASLEISLGDWSIPEGMGFWPRLNHAQVVHDNRVYPINRSDREIMKPGRIRVGTLNDSGLPVSSVLYEQLFMPLN